MVDSRNSFESVFVSISLTLNLLAQSMETYCVYVFYQYLVKEVSFRRSLLYLLGGDEFTKEGFRRSPPVPNSQYDVARFHSCFMI